MRYVRVTTSETTAGVTEIRGHIAAHSLAEKQRIPNPKNVCVGRTSSGAREGALLEKKHVQLVRHTFFKRAHCHQVSGLGFPRLR